MSFLRRDRTADVDDATADADPEAAAVPLTKGHPTPKRRDSQGRRGPVTAPKTRKEATARARRLDAERKAASKSAPPRSAAEQRAALKRGDPDALPRKDQGPTRQIARDYVDSNRMLSNYLLWLFPLLVAGWILRIQVLELVVLVLFVGFLVEWFVVGRRICRLAVEREGRADGGPMTIGFYAGSRAYLPRKWRLPGPRVERGEEF